MKIMIISKGMKQAYLRRVLNMLNVLPEVTLLIGRGKDFNMARYVADTYGIAVETSTLSFKHLTPDKTLVLGDYPQEVLEALSTRYLRKRVA